LAFIHCKNQPPSLPNKTTPQAPTARRHPSPGQRPGYQIEEKIEGPNARTISGTISEGAGGKCPCPRGTYPLGGGAPLLSNFQSYTPKRVPHPAPPLGRVGDHKASPVLVVAFACPTKSNESQTSGQNITPKNSIPTSTITNPPESLSNPPRTLANPPSTVNHSTHNVTRPKPAPPHPKPF